MVRAVLDIGLRQHGLCVWLAANGQEAVAVYQCHRQDIGVALLDVRMPERDGPQILAALREIEPTLCCCFMTGDLGHYTEEDLLRLRVARVFYKPFQLSELAEVLGKLVSGRGSNPQTP